MPDAVVAAKLWRRFWITLGCLAALALFVYGVRSVLLPFVAGLAVAYLLDPLADLLERLKFPRWLATITILAGFFALVTAVIMASLPLLQSQFMGVLDTLPRYVAKIKPVFSSLAEEAGYGSMSEILATFTTQVITIVRDGVLKFVGGGLALFNLFSLLLISPVVAFYLLRDWDILVERIDGWLPRKQEPTIKKLLIEMDSVLSGFVRGQLLVCLVMGVLYAVAWSLIDLRFAVVLGLFAGLMSFIPFVGSFAGLLLALIVALGQFGSDYLMVGAVAAIFFGVQFLESSVLGPRLIGDRVGLHPVWILFAVFAGGEVLGFVGVLIAVPVAALVAVLARFALSKYLGSSLYNETVDPGEPVGDGPTAGQREAEQSP